MRKLKISCRVGSDAVFVFAALLCAGAVVLSLSVGAAGLHPGELWNAIRSGPNHTAGYIFWYLRLPRTAACLLAGAGLAAAGAVIQGVLGNHLASPGVIGVNAGAGLMVTVCGAAGIYSGWLIAGAAFLGALGAVLLVTAAARRTGASRTTVILGGVAVNYILNALSEGIRNLMPEVAVMSADFRVGDFSTVAFPRLIPAGILICGGLAALLTLCSELDLLTLGEETAGGLGLPVGRVRTLLLLLAALLCGASVSFSGLLGFVGLIVPHAARSFVGSESRKLLPLCALMGAGFVTLCDTAARALFAPFEFPVGILLSLLGGPFFLLLLFRRREEHWCD